MNFDHYTSWKYKAEKCAQFIRRDMKNGFGRKWEELSASPVVKIPELAKQASPISEFEFQSVWVPWLKKNPPYTYDANHEIEYYSSESASRKKLVLELWTRLVLTAQLERDKHNERTLSPSFKQQGPLYVHEINQFPKEWLKEIADYAVPYRNHFNDTIYLPACLVHWKKYKEEEISIELNQTYIIGGALQKGENQKRPLPFFHTPMTFYEMTEILKTQLGVENHFKEEFDMECRIYDSAKIIHSPVFTSWQIARMKNVDMHICAERCTQENFPKSFMFNPLIGSHRHDSAPSKEASFPEHLFPYADTIGTIVSNFYAAEPIQKNIKKNIKNWQKNLLAKPESEYNPEIHPLYRFVEKASLEQIANTSITKSKAKTL